VKIIGPPIFTRCRPRSVRVRSVLRDDALEPQLAGVLEYAAVALLIRRARDDDGPDEWIKQSPFFAGSADPRLVAWVLFERWIGLHRRCPGGAS
jgi:hypothetical protein